MFSANFDGKVFTVREADREDAALVYDYMMKLGEFQKMADHLTVTVDKLVTLIDSGAGKVIIGELEEEPVAFMYYYGISSAFIGEKGLYIDALLVDEEYRGQGIGKLMMKAIAKIAAEQGCRRLEWVCLDWNENAKSIYSHIGAEESNDFHIWRMPQENIEKLL